MQKQSMAERVESKLRAALTPTHLEVINESHLHSSGPGAESHFKVIIVSPEFEGKTLIDQHRLVNAALAEELKLAIHALTLKTVAPSKWQASTANYESPSCRGGSKS